MRRTMSIGAPQRGQRQVATTAPFTARITAIGGEQESNCRQSWSCTVRKRLARKPKWRIRTNPFGNMCRKNRRKGSVATGSGGTGKGRRLAKSRSVIFKWRQSEPEVIVMAVGWYLRFSLPYRDVEELLVEGGLDTDHVTVWRWVQRYAPELERRLRAHLKSTNKSWRVDETFVRVKGKWAYLYRAADSTGATIDFLWAAHRDADAPKRFFQKALGSPSHPTPRVINVDKCRCYPPAVKQLKKERQLRRPPNCS
jgi:transposase-like protein